MASRGVPVLPSAPEAGLFPRPWFDCRRWPPVRC